MDTEPHKIQNSRTLRKNQTPWEAKLWYHLRAGRFFGLKFKRQVPIGNYIVDISCFEKKLIIEADGGHHDLQKSQDEVRDKFLLSKGYKILRFWNNEIDDNFEGVLETIRREVFEPTSLPTSPLARGEERPKP
jgi:very-short-patch-repair endonuclease